MDLSKYWVYDMETYPSVITLAITNYVERRIKIFEISERVDEREELFEYLRNIVKVKGKMVGFNNTGFDYPVLHHLLKNKQSTVIELYNKSQAVIDGFYSENTFANVVRDKDELIPQVDLFKIHHYDNKAKMTSLKMLEFNMKMDNIEDLPFPVGTWLKGDEIDELKKYNAHDVIATTMFMGQSLKQIEFRVNLSKKLGKNVMNFNDTKIGKDFFVSELEKNERGVCYEPVGLENFTVARFKMRQTKRETIKLSECVFDYIKFERPEFNALLEWFKQQEISETKGVFTDILESDLGDVAKWANMVTKRKRFAAAPTPHQLLEAKEAYPKGWYEEVLLKSGKSSHYWFWNVATSLNLFLDGTEYVFGVGGIHAAKRGKYYSNDSRVIKSVDVASYYPNLCIQNKIYPEHLGENFPVIYQRLYLDRKTHPKGTAENEMLKLALNGTYGASNDQYSPLYDPKFMMSITINGQLSLVMLIEELLKVEGVEIIMANTDGLEYIVDRDKEHITDKICQDWEKLTKLDLEYMKYERLLIADVNNYVGVFDES